LTNVSPISSTAFHEVSNETEDWLIAARAAESKKAINLKVLDLREITSFTDYFVICSTGNPRQGQAICDEISQRMKDASRRPVSVEGYERAEWILIDYGDFIVHVFSEPARSYYDLERLWRHAAPVDLSLEPALP
jgi:ribosome-associated protein